MTFTSLETEVLRVTLTLKKSLFRFIAYYRFEDRWHPLLTENINGWNREHRPFPNQIN